MRTAAHSSARDAMRRCVVASVMHCNGRCHALPRGMDARPCAFRHAATHTLQHAVCNVFRQQRRAARCTRCPATYPPWVCNSQTGGLVYTPMCVLIYDTATLRPHYNTTLRHQATLRHCACAQMHHHRRLRRLKSQHRCRCRCRCCCCCSSVVVLLRVCRWCCCDVVAGAGVASRPRAFCLDIRRDM